MFGKAPIDLHFKACDQRNPLDQRNPIKIRKFRGTQEGYDTDLPDAKNRTSAAIVVLANEAEPPQKLATPDPPCTIND